MVLNVEGGTVDFTRLGMYDMTLVKTREGGLGVRITDFSEKDILYKGKGRRKIIQTDEWTMYAQWVGETKEQDNQGQERTQEPVRRMEDGGRPFSEKINDARLSKDAKARKSQRTETPTESIHEKEVSGRLSLEKQRTLNCKRMRKAAEHPMRHKAHLYSSAQVTKNCERSCMLVTTQRFGLRCSKRSIQCRIGVMPTKPCRGIRIRS